MLVSHHHQFVIIKNRRVAGTALLLALQPHMRGNADWPRGESNPAYEVHRHGPDRVIQSVKPAWQRTLHALIPEQRRLTRAQQTLRGLAEHAHASSVAAVLGSKRTSQYDGFGVVRNPWTAAASAYRFRMTKLLGHLPHSALPFRVSFDGWLSARRDSLETHRTPTLFAQIRRETNVPWTSVHRRERDPLVGPGLAWQRETLAIQGAGFRSEHIFRFEDQLPALLDVLSRRIGTSLVLPHINAVTTPSLGPAVAGSIGLEERITMSQQSVDLIAQECAWEIDRFGYTPPESLLG